MSVPLDRNQRATTYTADVSIAIMFMLKCHVYVEVAQSVTTSYYEHTAVLSISDSAGRIVTPIVPREV